MHYMYNRTTGRIYADLPQSSLGCVETLITLMPRLQRHAASWNNPEKGLVYATTAVQVRA